MSEYQEKHEVKTKGLSYFLFFSHPDKVDTQKLII